MDKKEYEALLVSIEQMIETSLRGYRRGKHFPMPGRLEKTAREHDRLYGSPDYDSGDQYLDADSRGLKPEGTC